MCEEQCMWGIWAGYPFDCTAELRPTIYVHFYASIRTHWFYFVNINLFFFFARAKYHTRFIRFYFFSFFCKSGWKRTTMAVSIIVLLGKNNISSAYITLSACVFRFGNKIWTPYCFFEFSSRETRVRPWEESLVSAGLLEHFHNSFKEVCLRPLRWLMWN